jgi:hypothetical protein
MSKYVSDSGDHFMKIDRHHHIGRQRRLLGYTAAEKIESRDSLLL